MFGGSPSQGRRRAFTVNPFALLVVAVIGCGTRDEAVPDVEPANVAALTSAQVAAARQAGLLPPLAADLPAPTLYEPTDGMDCTYASGINNAGTIVGHSEPCTSSPLPDLHQTYPFVATGPTVQRLPFPSAATTEWVTGINDEGYIAAYGYAASPETYSSVLYRPGTWTQAEVLPFQYGTEGLAIANAPRGGGLPYMGVLKKTSSTAWRWAGYQVAAVGQTGTTALVTIPSGYDATSADCAPRAVNRNNDTAGSCKNGSGVQVAMWAQGSLSGVDLNTLLPANSGWLLRAALAINDNRQVVGYGTIGGNHRAFLMDLWASPKTIVDLGTLPGYTTTPTTALAVNAKGHVVGTVGAAADATEMHLLAERAWIYTKEWGLTDLNSLVSLPGWTLAEATGINDQDEVVGYAKNAAGQRRAFKVKVTRGPEFIEPTNGLGCSEPMAINNQGTVIGYSDACSAVPWINGQAAYPFVTEGNVAQRLPVPGYISGYYPFTINDAGYIVVAAIPGTGAYPVYLHRNNVAAPQLLSYPNQGGTGTVISNLQPDGTATIASIFSTATAPDYWIWGRYQVGASGAGQVLSPNIAHPPQGYTGEGGPYAMNANGDLAGWYTLTGGARSAMVWTAEDGIRDLNGLIDPASGWFLRAAFGINNARQIVGFGRLSSQSHAFVFDLTTQELTEIPNLELPYNTLSHQALAINAQGHVVGMAGTDGSGAGYHVYGERAFFWSRELGTTDLNDLALLPPGWVLASAVAINDNDEVTGYAVGPGGARRAYKLTIPSSMMLQSGDEPAEADVFPSLSCKYEEAGKPSRAVFTYQSTNTTNVRIPKGAQNAITVAGPLGVGDAPEPPEWFFPGTTVGAVVVPYPEGGSASWTLGTHAASTADLPSPPTCTVTQGSDGLAALIGPHLPPLPDRRVLIEPNLEYPFQGTVVATEASYTSADAEYDASLAPYFPAIGPRAAGALPAQFRVTDDGAAQYEIPLVTPPGRAGVEPHLRLVYNSRSGDGALGVGWTLAGLSKISRCTRTLADAQKAAAGGNAVEPQAVQFDATDELCMDGEHLVQVSDGSYRTQRDVFAKIVVVSSDAKGPRQFDVYRQNGRIESYGSSASSRIDIAQRFVDADGSLTGESGQVRAAWYLSKVEDRFQNQMTISYVRQFEMPTQVLGSTAVEAEAMPDEIRYTNNAATGRIDNRSVKFNYVDYQTGQPTLLATSGWIRARAKVIKSIDVNGPAPVSEGLIRRYKFTYDTDLGDVRKLSRAQVCDASNVCQAPTQFWYQTLDTTFEKVDTPVFDAYLRQADLYPSYGYLDFQNWSRSLVAADVNGDGRDDLIYRLNVPPPSSQLTGGDPAHDPQYMVRLSSGSGFGLPVPAGFPAISAAEFQTHTYPTPMMTDLDRDGRIDAIYPYRASGITSAATHLFDLFVGGSSSANPLVSIPVPVADAQYSNPAVNLEAVSPTNRPQLIVADVTGDGVPDLLRALGADTNARIGARAGAGARSWGSYENVEISNPGSKQSLPVWNRNVPGGRPVAADVDGDGRAELVYIDTINITWDTRYSIAHFDGTTWTLKESSLPASNAQPPMFIDYNGDGLKDALTFTSNLHNTSYTATMWLNIGTGFVKGPVVDSQMSEGTVVDFDGNGREDIVVYGNDRDPTAVEKCRSPVIFLSNGNGSFSKHVLTDVPAPVVIDGPGLQHRCLRVMLDANGDGMQDFVQAEEAETNLQLYRNRGKAINRAIQIRNGIGSTTVVEYGKVTEAATGCASSEECGRKVDVVSAYEIDNGTGDSRVSAGRNRFVLEYSHPVTDRFGRGFQGFSSRSETNQRTLETRTLTFNLARSGTYYPFAGMPVDDVTDTRLASGGMIRKERKTRDFSVISGDILAGIPFAVRPHVIDELEFGSETLTDWQGVPALTTRTTTLSYDSFGNLLGQHVESSNQFRATVAIDNVDYTYEQDLQHWLVSKLKTISRHSVGPNGESADRLTRIDTYELSGAVHFEHVEPAAGSGDERLDVEHVVDAEGNTRAIVSTDLKGDAHVDSLAYDDADAILPTSSANALGHVTRFLYHGGLGVLARRSDPNGATTTWLYDGLGRLRQERSTSAPMTQLSYLRWPSDAGNDRGFSVAVMRDGGGGGSTTFDSLGREVSSSTLGADNQLRTQTKTYDPTAGALSSVTLPSAASTAGTTTIVYDEARRPIQVSSPGELPQFISYKDLVKTVSQGATRQTAVAKKAEVRDEMGRTTESVDILDQLQLLPGRGSLVTVHSTKTDFELGPFGALRRVYNRGDNKTVTTELQYDRLGRRTVLIDPDAGTRRTRYDAFGAVRTEIDAQGVETAYERDALGRVLSITRSGATDVYVWDGAPGVGGLGQLYSSISSSAVVSLNRYFSNGQLQTQTTRVDGASYGIDFDYDLVDHKLSHIYYPAVTADGRVTLGYEYNALDGLPSALSMTHSTDAVWRRLSLSSGGAPSVEALGNGTVSLHDYDDVTGRLMHIATGSGTMHAGGSGYQEPSDTIQSLTYTYDGAGRVWTKRDWVSDATDAYSYDNIDRLKTWSTAGGSHSVTYDYSDLGNLLARHETTSGTTVDEVYTYGGAGAGPHALTGSQQGSYSYDANGRQTARPGQPVLSYGRLDVPNLIQHDGTTTSFRYDADGTRVQKTTGLASTTYVGGLYERRAVGGVVTHVFLVPGGHGTIAQLTCAGADGAATCEAGAFTYLHTDIQGTVDTTTKVDPVTTDLTVTRVARDPYGRVIGGASQADGVHVGYTHEEQDDEVGLVNLNHRLYDPKIGRFLATDPLVAHLSSAQGFNRYAYAQNSPTLFTDRLGLADSSGAGDTTTVNPPPPPPAFSGTTMNVGENGIVTVVEWTYTPPNDPLLPPEDSPWVGVGSGPPPVPEFAGPGTGQDGTQGGNTVLVGYLQPGSNGWDPAATQRAIDGARAFEEIGLVPEANQARQLAVDLATTGLDLKGRSVLWNPGLRPVAITQHGETQVGAQAFRSAGYLRSTIGPHEGTHHEQQLRGLTGLGPRAEIEALNAELNAAEQNGLNAWEINELYRLRGAQLMELNYGPRWWSIPGLSPLR